jgi:hypothetical protein
MRWRTVASDPWHELNLNGFDAVIQTGRLLTMRGAMAVSARANRLTTESRVSTREFVVTRLVAWAAAAVVPWMGIIAFARLLLSPA